jgi:RNA polymerase sigma-70 factor (ECF subfamily)
MGMGFPALADEMALHERVLQEDPVVSAEVFRAFMDPLIRILMDEDRCNADDAHDSAIDALFAYFRAPERYDRRRAKLSTYLIQAAKRRAADRRRSNEARARRERKYADDAERDTRNPKEVLDTQVEAGLAVELLATVRLDARDVEFLRLIIQGESSTERLAEVLGMGSLPDLERRREVKRHRDRLMQLLRRVGREASR